MKNGGDMSGGRVNNIRMCDRGSGTLPRGQDRFNRPGLSKKAASRQENSEKTPAKDLVSSMGLNQGEMELEHSTSMLAPHSSQNFTPCRFAALHLGQFISPSRGKRALHYESFASSSSAFFTHPSEPHSV
jgi:hypothetical protein